MMYVKMLFVSAYTASIIITISYTLRDFPPVLSILFAVLENFFVVRSGCSHVIFHITSYLILDLG